MGGQASGRGWKGTVKNKEYQHQFYSENVRNYMLGTDNPLSHLIPPVKLWDQYYLLSEVD